MENLCKAISMPEEVTRELVRIDADPAFQPDTRKLFCPHTWEEGLSELRSELREDPRGLKMLCAQLRCAKEAEKKYQEMGISREIYVDTMAAFSRFVNEHMESYGTYAFDRAFWTVRQISCMLFRVGQMEFELVTRDGKPSLELHIPSDTRMETALLRRSYEMGREFLRTYFPEHAESRIYGESWLFSPDLDELLPASSRIMQFKKNFVVTETMINQEDVVQWVFKNPKLELSELPEHTSLQKKLKAFLLEGRQFREGKAYMIDEPFLD